MRRKTMGQIVMSTIAAFAWPAMGMAAEATGDSAAARPAPGMSDPNNASFALGFHNTTAPLGGRFWFKGQHYAIDFGAGYKVEEATLSDDSGHLMTTINLDIGVPIAIRRWDKLRVIGRPGILLQTTDVEIANQDANGDPLPSEVAKFYTVALRAELEAEYFFVDRLSASAGYGVQYARDKLDFPGAVARGSSETFGAGFFELGFHLYLWSGQ